MPSHPRTYSDPRSAEAEKDRALQRLERAKDAFHKAEGDLVHDAEVELDDAIAVAAEWMALGRWGNR